MSELPEVATTPPSSGPELSPERQVFGWIVEGQKESDIVDAIHHQFPDRDAGEIVGGAMDMIEASGRFSHDVVRGWCYEAYRELYRRMVEIGDYAGALKAVKEIRQML